MIPEPVRWFPFLFLAASCGPTHSQLDVAAVHFVVTRNTHVFHIVEGDTLSLDLRIPMPSLSGAPGIIFLHGGGFSQGHRSKGPHTAFLDSLARQGIASASISYRLTRAGLGFGCAVPVHEKKAAVESAAQDLMAALDWLRSSPLALPPEWVAAGSSAGAEAALRAGYAMAPQNWAGVISFAGALSSDSEIPENAPPFFAAHGTCDGVVPADEGIHRGCHEEQAGAWSLCGGLCWAQRLSDSGLGSVSHAYCGGGHEVCNSAMLDPILQQSLVAWLCNPNRERLTERIYVSEGREDKSGEGPCPQPCQ